MMVGAMKKVKAVQLICKIPIIFSVLHYIFPTIARNATGTSAIAEDFPRFLFRAIARNAKLNLGQLIDFLKKHSIKNRLEQTRGPQWTETRVLTSTLFASGLLVKEVSL